jgi:FimV-like protein
MALFSQLDRQGEHGRAYALAEEWAAQHPKDFAVPTLAGQHSMQRKDFERAARWYRLALNARPNHPVTLNNLAWVLGQMRDSAALEYGEKALSLAPNAPAILDTVGWLYVEKGDVARGVELLKKANSIAPNSPSIALNLAKGLIKAGDREGARSRLEALAKLPGDSAVKQEAEKLLASL